MPSDTAATASSLPDREFRSVRGPTIPSVVAERIRDAILSGKYRSGERLVEQKLAGLFGIGQPTVREALRELEVQGFVRKQPNRATFVTEFTEEDVRKSHEVRLALETLAVEKAAPNMTPADFAKLESIVQMMEEKVIGFDRAAFHRLDMAFHRTIWACTKNEYLEAALERVTFSLFAFQLLRRKPGDSVMNHVAEQHREMLNALRLPDPVAAREAFTGAICDFWRKFQKVAE